jgi:hypothetical protein
VFDVRIKKISQNIEYRIVSNLTANNKMFKFETELSQNRTIMEKLHELKYFMKTKKIEQKDKYQEF